MNAKRSAVILFVIFLAWGRIQAQSDSIRVLFIGNSFTNGSDMPYIFRDMAIQAGLPVFVSSITKNGQSVSYFVNNAGVYQRIASGRWDFIVFQDYQGYYYGPHGTFDSIGMDIHLLAKNISFQDSITQLAPCAKIIYFAGWEKKGGRPDLYPGDNTEKLITRILDNYRFLNDQPGVNNRIAPVGVAWLKWMEKPIYEELYINDQRHPTYAGSYLTACVFISALFNKDAGDIDYQGDLTKTVAQDLGHTAYEAVRDSFAYSRLIGTIAELTLQENKLHANPGYQVYKWYRNGELVAETMDPLFKPLVTGNYSVECYNAQGCRTRSSNLAVAEIVGIAANTVITDSSFIVYPNPVEKKLYVADDPSHFWFGEISLYDSHGKQVAFYGSNPGRTELDLSDLPNGIYILQARKKDAVKTIRLVKMGQ